MADLTRFDFHVNRFLNSEDVENMTAEEVGQYILLLCHSFVKGREASLPDDPSVLARYARADKVSKLVLKKFPVVETEWGPRRRNETLYTEFLLAKKRSENGRSAVAQRWENESNTPVIPPYKSSSTNLDTHTIPYQSIPNHTTPSNPDSGFPAGNWKTFAIHFRNKLGKFISSTKTNKQKYMQFTTACGEDKVLSAFDGWAEQNKNWVSEKGDPLFYFFNDVLDLVDALESETEQKKKDGPEVAPEQVAAAMSSSLSERQKEIDLELDRIRKQKEFEEEHKDEI